MIGVREEANLIIINVNGRGMVWLSISSLLDHFLKHNYHLIGLHISLFSFSREEANINKMMVTYEHVSNIVGLHLFSTIFSANL